MGRTARKLERAIITVIICIDRGFSLFLRIIGPCLVCVCLGLQSMVVYVYFRTLLPDIILPRLGVPLAVLYTVVGLWILFNILFNYLSCVFVRPGSPPPIEFADGMSVQEYVQLLNDGKVRLKPGWRFCKRCEAEKPPRAHHCTVCNRCILRMDHHCPWVNTCVGFYNYKHFVLFLAYLATGCGYTVLCAAMPFFDGSYRRHRNTMLLFTFVLCCSVLFALTLFLGWHLYLTFSAQTTIEFYSNRWDASQARREGQTWKNPYSLGLRANFEQVFGPSRYFMSWAMPSWQKPPGDGMDYLTNDGGDAAFHEV